ncbi:26502_t:CDS:1 [Racocetra persica]|uniref:26502_t:CDS:1 n=1 Tax=Racocetra persica TaxID=160502 RepID=A0ACA9L9M6_9GLOM|nr:26502_t:CDS:1 [Racocetra persica]
MLYPDKTILTSNKNRDYSSSIIEQKIDLSLVVEQKDYSSNEIKNLDDDILLQDLDKINESIFLLQNDYKILEIIRDDIRILRNDCKYDYSEFEKILKIIYDDIRILQTDIEEFETFLLSQEFGVYQCGGVRA